jgi:hypothetical protein
MCLIQVGLYLSLPQNVATIYSFRHTESYSDAEATIHGLRLYQLREQPEGPFEQVDLRANVAPRAIRDSAAGSKHKGS